LHQWQVFEREEGDDGLLLLARLLPGGVQIAGPGDRGLLLRTRGRRESGGGDQQGE
jgi:hypothetical protein